MPSLIISADEVQLDPALDADANPQVLPHTTRLPLAHDFLLHVIPAASQILDFLIFHQPYSKRALSSSAFLAQAIAGIFYASFIEFHCSIDGICAFCQSSQFTLSHSQCFLSPRSLSFSHHSTILYPDSHLRFCYIAFKCFPAFPQWVTFFGQRERAKARLNHVIIRHN